MLTCYGCDSRNVKEDCGRMRCSIQLRYGSVLLCFSLGLIRPASAATPYMCSVPLGFLSVFSSEVCPFQLPHFLLHTTVCAAKVAAAAACHYGNWLHSRLTVGPSADETRSWEIPDPIQQLSNK